MAFVTDISPAYGGLTPQQQAAVGGAAQAAASLAALTRTAGQPPTQRGGDDGLTVGSLVPLAAIQGGVREGLESHLRDTQARVAGLTLSTATAGRLAQILGSAEGGDGMAGRMNQFVQSFAGLAALWDTGGTAAPPDGQAVAAGQAKAVQAMTRLTDGLRQASQQLQAARQQADDQLQAAVGEANATLARLAQANDRIAVQASAGGATAASLAERDSLLGSLASSLDFASFTRADGTVAVFTKGGVPLVDGGKTATLACPSLSTAPSPEPSPAPTGEPAATAAAAGSLTANGVDIAAQVGGGRIHALKQARDQQVPAVQAQLDTLAQTLQSRVNQISNRALAGSAAASAYTGTRRFAAPADERLGFGGSDTVLTLRDGQGQVQAQTSLGLAVRQYRQDAGLPAADAWPPSQVAAAVDHWLGQNGGGSAALDGDGRLAISLPEGSSLGLRDQQTTAYQSRLTAAPDQPLGLKGALSFTDATGNVMSTSRAAPPLDIVPTDGLGRIAAKLNAIGGVAASLVEGAGGSALRVATTTGSGLTLQADAAEATVVRGLGLLPAADLAAEDAVVQYRGDNRAGSFTGRPVPGPDAPLGVSGVLSVTDGASRTAIALDASASLNGIAGQITAGLSGSGINAAVVPMGNQFTLKIAGPAGRQFSLDGPSDALQTPPSSDFSAAAGSLEIRQGGRSVGSLAIAAGSDLAAIASGLNDPAAPFAAQGIVAEVGEAGGGRYLQVATSTGLPLSFAGSATGTGAGRLQFAVNPRDGLGLLPQADQVVPGFANFTGLNDLFVADPADAFDAKAPTGIFTSTAALGTAGALAVNPAVAAAPGTLDRAIAQDVADLLTQPVPVAAAGGIERSNVSLGQYVQTVTATQQATAARSADEASFQAALGSGLEIQRRSLSALDLGDRLDRLATFQQAYRDSAHIVSTMPQLVDHLRLAAA